MATIRQLEIDIECYSSADLMKCGVYRYAEAIDFEILLFGYSTNGGKVHVIDLTQGEQIPLDILSALTDETVTKWAFNANFERICLSRYLGMPTGEYLDPSQWRCTMIWSAYLGLPLSLKGVGSALGLGKQKLDEGKELIRYFCMPCAATKGNGGRTRNMPADAPEQWALFIHYNLRDVETEMEIQEKLRRFPVPEDVWDQYHLDQEINDRGIRVDSRLVRNAITMDTRSREELVHLMQVLTALNNPNSVAQMKQWLADNGLETDTLGKKQVASLLKDAPKPLGDVLSLRQQLAKSSVKKYQAMANAMCADGRVRGMFQFYGANRSGRWAGRGVQLQNLPQNHMPDLAQARELVRSGDYEIVNALYDSVPTVLSELIRTAFIPRDGAKFIVSDFSAIEARVIAWLAGEQWRLDVFERGDDIYCMSASQMFGVPVEKHGINGHLRQKGKVAELACIAEGQLVLTNHGLIPIEHVALCDRLWDGIEWVTHHGLIYKGEREVISYEGLTATPDHLVWIEGTSKPVRFEHAAASGAHLIQTGNGRRAIRPCEDHFTRETMERVNEPVLCPDPMPGLRKYTVAIPQKFDRRCFSRLPALLAAQTDTQMAGKTFKCSKTTLYKPERSWLSKLRGKRYTLRILKRHRSGTILARGIRLAGQSFRDRQNRYQRPLRKGQSAIHCASRKQFQQARHSSQWVRTAILAVCLHSRHQETVWRRFARWHHFGCNGGRTRKTKKLADHQRTARLYDIRDAGPRHRFTVSGKLVHNCGYGGSVGALKAMGALDMGLQEEELKPLVDAWRKANPRIVKLWWDVDKAVMTAVRDRTTTKSHGITFSYQSAMLFITLPSGRRLAYVRPRIGVNQFGSDCITYMGVGSTKKWERIESFGGKFVENVVQAISRDILCYALQTLRCCSIVAHVHDEVIIESDLQMSLQAVCDQMGRTPPWAKGLMLRADGFECDFYQKD